MADLAPPLRTARPATRPLQTAELPNAAPPPAASPVMAPPAAAASSLTRHMRARKLYIFTLPKAGTYFLAQLLSRMGWYDSGIHLAEDHYLDTHRQDLQSARCRPLDVMRTQSYDLTLRALPYGALCFGHMNPMYFARPHLSEVAVLACRRHPREALVAEFIDFRFRRDEDWVRWVHPSRIPDDRLAFAEYLRQHGRVIADIVATYIAYRQLRQTDFYTGTREMGEYVDLRFEDLMGPAPLPAMRSIAQTFGQRLDDATLIDILTGARGAENKTKSVGESIAVDRAALWTPQAEAAYQTHGFPRLAELLGYPG